MVTRADSKVDEIKEVGDVKQDLNLLKNVGVIENYMEDLKGWIERMQDKLEMLSSHAQGKHP